MKNRDDLCRWRTMMDALWGIKNEITHIYNFFKIVYSFQHFPKIIAFDLWALLFLKISNFPLHTVTVLILHIRWLSFLYILNIIFYFGFYHVQGNCLFRKVFRLELIFSRITRLFLCSSNLAENTLQTQNFSPKASKCGLSS